MPPKSLKASQVGIYQLKKAIKTKGWLINDPRWRILVSKSLNPHSGRNWDEYLMWKLEDLEAEIMYIVAPGISLETWKRFLRGSSITAHVFQACCEALEVRWQDIVESPPLDIAQQVTGVQKAYTDPKDYVGSIWTQIIPESQNIDKRHMITINWGSWSWQKVKKIPGQGLLLIYRKRFKDFYQRIVTVSTFADKHKDKVTLITSATKIVNSHLPIEYSGRCLKINSGWEETWGEPPSIEVRDN